MLSNAYFLENFRFDAAENEPAKNLQNFAKICPNFANFANPNPLTPKVCDRHARRRPGVEDVLTGLGDAREQALHGLRDAEEI